MPDRDQHEQLITLLRDTGAAHHRAYRATDGADPDWPLWYAEEMQARLNSILGTALTRSELTYFLVWVEKERAAQSPKSPWPEYYTDFFLERSGAMAGQMPATPQM